MQTRPVTVLVPFYNEEAFLAQKLENCLGIDQSLVERFVFVDDASTDRGADMVKQAGGQGRVLVLHNQCAKGKTGAIKTGLEHAESRYVLVTDADIDLKEDALRLLVAALEKNPRWGLVFGEVDRYASLSQMIIHRFLRFLSLFESAVSCAGQCYLFRKELDLDVDDRIISDDVDLPIQTRRKGFFCKAVPAAVFSDRRKDTGDRTASRRRVVGLYQAFLKHAAVFLNPRYGLYGMVCFPAMVLFIPGLALFYLAGISLVGIWLWVFQPFVGCLFFTAVFGIKRIRELTLYATRTIGTIIAFLFTRDAGVRWRAS